MNYSNNSPPNIIQTFEGSADSSCTVLDSFKELSLERVQNITCEVKKAESSAKDFIAYWPLG